MKWSAILKLALLAALYYAAWLRDRGRLEVDRAETIAASLKSALDEIAKAREARNAVVRDLSRTKRMRGDDGFKRSD